MPPAMTKKPPTPPGAFTPEDYNGKKKSGLCCENFSGNENACAASKLDCKWKKKTGKCVIEEGVTKRCTFPPPSHLAGPRPADSLPFRRQAVEEPLQQPQRHAARGQGHPARAGGLYVPSLPVRWGPAR